MRLCALIALTLLCVGCACKGGRRYPIIGFGWVTISTNSPVVVDMAAIGLNAGRGQFNIGLAHVTTITVTTNAHIVIDLLK